MGTINQEAYVLHGWFRFCEENQRSWKEVDDHFLLFWRTSEEKRKIGRHRDDLEAWNRISYKISVIYNFYHVMQTVLFAFHEAIISDPGRDGGQETALSITINGPETGGKLKIVRRVRYTTKPEIRVGRPTPRPHEVEKVKDRAADRPTDYASSTHYLMARCAAETGMRAIGICNLTVEAVAQGLLDEGIGVPTDRGALQSCDLHVAASRWNDRILVTEGLEKMKYQKRKNIFVSVTEKRKVTRKVRVPLILAREIIEYIWDDRFRFIEELRGRASYFEDSRQVFLSHKTGKRFVEKSVSNLLAIAFQEAGVAGSGHRLRAAYAEERARDFHLRQRSLHGRNYDPRAILFALSEELGHRNVKTLESYLNRITTEENLIPGEPILFTSSEHASWIRPLADALNSDNADALSLLKEIIFKLGGEPRPEPSSREDMQKQIRLSADARRARDPANSSKQR